MAASQWDQDMKLVMLNRELLTRYQQCPTSWKYLKGMEFGPSHWPSIYPSASGKNQSPINITTSQAICDPSLFEPPLTWNYDPNYAKTIVNTGHGWSVEFVGIRNYVEGGPVVNRYNLDQIHCHWGETNQRGSEHTVNGYNMAGEIHMVHWNTELYKDCREAACKSRGLLVLAVFVKLGDPNVELEKIIKVLGNIYFKGQRCSLREQINPAKFIPENPSYWTYEGSLTTPPCHESVTWIIFKKPITATPEQISKFRNIYGYADGEKPPVGTYGGRIILNNRPTQPLYGRLIRQANYQRLINSS